MNSTFICLLHMNKAAESDSVDHVITCVICTCRYHLAVDRLWISTIVMLCSHLQIMNHGDCLIEIAVHHRSWCKAWIIEENEGSYMIFMKLLISFNIPRLHHIFMIKETLTWMQGWENLTAGTRNGIVLTWLTLILFDWTRSFMILNFQLYIRVLDSGYFFFFHVNPLTCFLSLF